MSSVDDRIVNMQFNNSQFQSGAAATSQSLSTLEGTIAKMGSSTGLTDMGGQVQQVSTHFGALQIAAVTALATIVSKATEAGLALIKNLTLGPIMQGFEEYETNLNSIQTIMANTGAEIKVVNQYLDELNEYSDLTIYSFSQMAQNIGRFTAAGVDLEEATVAIKGMANTAALTGANAMQLSTAMYQMSQALSTGTIRLMDWRSLENANMGTENMRMALLETARATGTTGETIDALTDGTLKFRDSLETGWLTANIFTDTMKIMAGTLLKDKDLLDLTKKELEELGWKGKEAGDAVAFTVEQLKEMGYETKAAVELNRLSQAAIDSAQKVKTISQLLEVTKEQIGSGWAQVFERLFGNFNQASKMWSAVSEKIGDTVKGIFGSVDKVLAQWQEMGGYKALWEGIGNIFQILGNLIGPFVDAFQSLFPATKQMGSGLATASKGFASFTGMLVVLTEKLDFLTPILSAVFGAFSYIAGVVGDVIQGLAPVIDLIGELASKMGDLAQQGIAIGKSLIDGVLEGMGITDIKTSIENFANSIVDWIKSTLGIASPAAELVPVGEAIVLGIAEGIANTIGVIGEAFVIVLDAILELLPVIYMKFLKIPTLFIMALAGALPPVRLAMVSIIETILGTIGDAIPAVVNVINDLLGGIFDILKTNIPKLADVLLVATTELIGYLSAALPMFITFGIEMVLAIINGIAEAAPQIVTGLAAIISAIAGAIGQVLGTLISSIQAGISSGVGDSMNSLDWANIFKGILAGGFVAALLKVAIDIGNFLNTLESNLNPLTATLTQMQQTLKAAALMAIAIAIGILAASIIGLSLLKSEQLNQGLGAISGMAIMLGTLMLALNRLPPGKIESATGSLVALSGALVLMAVAIRILSGLSWEELAKGIGTIAYGLATFVGALYVMERFGSAGPQAALGLLAIAGAMVMMAIAVRILSEEEWGDLALGVGTMAASLGVFILALKGMEKIGPSVAGSAGALLILAGAMLVMSIAIRSLASLDWMELARGMGAVGISLALMVGALWAISKMKGDAVASSTALLAISGAMFVMAMTLRILGQLEWEEIIKGLIGLAGAFAVVLIAARFASDPTLAAGLAVLSAAMLSLGGAAALLGLGLLAAATAFTLFASLTAAGIAAMIAGITALLTILPFMAQQLALAIVSFIQTIADAAPQLREAIGTILKEMLGAIRDSMPEFAKTFNELIDTIVKIVRNNHKEIGKIFTTLIETGLKVIRKTIPDFVDTGLAIILAFMHGIKRDMDDIIDLGTDIVIKFIKGIGDGAGDILIAAGETMQKFLDRMEKWTRNGEHISQMVETGIQIGKNILQGIADGLKLPSFIEMIKQAAIDVANAIPDWMMKVLIMHSPSKVAMWIGEMFVEGLAIGIRNSIGRAVGATVAMANAVIAAGDKAIRRAARQASKRQWAAEKAAAKAKIIERQAKAAEKLAAKSPKNKALQNAAKDARKDADKQAKAAQAAQKRADAASQKVSDVQAFRSADDQGKGDILTARATELSDRAIKKLAEANAAALAAKKVTGKERDRLKREAEEAAKAAKRLADQSKKASERANDYYAKSVKDRIAALKAEREAQKEQEAFESATDEEKILILQERMETAQRRAAAAQKQSEALVKQARKLAKTDAARSLRLLDRAERLAEQANESANEAKESQEEIDRYSDQSSSTTSATNFTLSKSAMEDAASAIDRYTKSLQQAEEAAAAATPIYQFVQNNTSPVALSEVEIYRQSKNLLSASEVKMGV